MAPSVHDSMSALIRQPGVNLPAEAVYQQPRLLKHWGTSAGGLATIRSLKF